MARIDALKEDIAFEKQVFTLLAAAEFATVGWLITNVFREPRMLVYLATFALWAVSLALVFLARRVKNKIVALEEL